MLILSDYVVCVVGIVESSSNTSCSSSQGDAGIDDVLDSVSQQGNNKQKFSVFL